LPADARRTANAFSDFLKAFVDDERSLHSNSSTLPENNRPAVRDRVTNNAKILSDKQKKRRACAAALYILVAGAGESFVGELIHWINS